MKKLLSISPSFDLGAGPLLLLFTATFMLIQPSKIAAATLNMPVLLGNFIIPVPFYIAHLLAQNESFQLRVHFKLLGGQVFLILLSLGFSAIYLNAYLLFFLFTPHYFLLACYLFKKSSENNPFPLVLALYIILLSVLCIVSIATFKFQFSLIEEFKGITTSFFTRDTTIQRSEILKSVNFSKQLFGTSEKTLAGVALTVYPLLYFGVILASWPKLMRSKLHLIAVACSLTIIAFKSSRGELLFLCALALYPLVRTISTRFRWIVLMPLGVGFIQLFLGVRTLNGRKLLNDLFLNNITLTGRGIGFSADAIFELSQNRYSSFHNIHMDIITNFGLILYFIFLIGVGYYLMRKDYTPAKHLIVCFGFILFATNFEIFDMYFWIPIAYALSCPVPHSERINALRQDYPDSIRSQISV